MLGKKPDPNDRTQTVGGILDRCAAATGKDLGKDHTPANGLEDFFGVKEKKDPLKPDWL